MEREQNNPYTPMKCEQDFPSTPKTIPPHRINECLGRQTARSSIEETILRLRREQTQLQALLDALPSRLPQEADEILLKILVSLR